MRVWWGGGLLGAVVAVAGCGGIAVFDEAGGGGQGGAGDGGSSADVGGGGPPPEVCVSFCAGRERARCGDLSEEECVYFCGVSREYAGRCVDLIDEAYRCVTPRDAQECDQRDLQRCDDVRERLDACVHPPGDCNPTGSVPDDDSDLTVLRCGGIEYGSRCIGNFAEADSVACTCFVDGVEVGTCDDEFSVAATCCNQFFAENGR